MTQITWIFGSLLFLFAVARLVQRGRLSERYAAGWFAVGLLAMISSIFPSALIWLASLLGFETPSNLAFFFAILCLASINLQLSSELTEMKHRERTIAQTIALAQNKLPSE